MRRVPAGPPCDPCLWPRPALCLPVGPPGCGKSRLGRRLQERLAVAGRRLVLVSRDQARIELFGRTDDFSDERIVTETTYRQLAKAVEAGADVYLDQTNLSARLRDETARHLAEAHPGVTVVGLLWAGGLTVDGLMARNAERAASEPGRGIVPLEVVERMWGAWERTWPAHLAGTGCAIVCLFDDEGLFWPAGPPLPTVRAAGGGGGGRADPGG